MTMSMLAARGLELLLLIACVAAALATPGGGTRRRIAARVQQAAGQRSLSLAAGRLQPGEVRQDLTRRLAQLGERLPVLDPMQRVKLGLQLTRAGFRERRACGEAPPDRRSCSSAGRRLPGRRDARSALQRAGLSRHRSRSEHPFSDHARSFAPLRWRRRLMPGV